MLTRKYENYAQTLLPYLTIIPRVGVEYELAIIISYPTSATGIIALLKPPTIYSMLPSIRTLQFKIAITLLC